MMLKSLWPAALALALGGPATAAPTLDTAPVPARPKASTLPAHWQQGVFMEVFVRAYQDSDGDGIGDLKGLTSRLDYLKRLGVSGLWLMPIQASADHDHGYATQDFRAVEPAYGTLQDFDTLIREAHKRGIGIVMDYVLNHTSHQHPAFQAALSSPTSPWRDWFVWADPAQPQAIEGWDIWGKNPWYDANTQPWNFAGEWKDLPKPVASSSVYFGTFGPNMPDFNHRNPDVVRYHEDSLRFWLNRGLDGFRLDAVPHLIENNAKDWNDQPESRALTHRFVELIKSYPGRYVVCEATAEPRAYGDPAVCGGAFEFGLQYEIIKAAQGDAEALAKVSQRYASMPATMATFLHNHDIFTGLRVWDQLKGDEARYRLAAASYLLLPGTPFIYYGEEIGLAGIAGKGDEPLRAPMSWRADGGFSSNAAPFRALSPNHADHNASDEARRPDSLLNFYRQLIALRKRLPALTLGRYEGQQVNGTTWQFQRVQGRQRVWVAMNFGTEVQAVTLDTGRAGSRLRDALAPSPQSQRTDAQGRLTLSLPPLSLRVLEIR